ncbi:MAG: o-succinylbenzoate synthase [Chloroflexi bacterium]|nr:o-succinylbenzoate synthase [Chloroflexota bacterium]MCI0648323.1 o-succinylbenzoate synthase [Chloroflexota bacterium]MCI0726555.1 o-succinylbenzoate synthase [Chloroflexota bacterium]
MKIERLDLYHISQPLVSPFVTSFGRQEERHCLILALHSEGLTGWGECVANSAPGYSYETVGTAWHILSDFLIPAVLGRELQEPEEIAGWLKFVRGHPLAKAALDQAAWDITAQRDGLSLARKLAQPYPEGPRRRVKVGVSIGIQPTIDQTLAVIHHHLDEGYGRIKLKIRPGHDVDLARAARAAFPDTLIMLDANSAYRLEDAIIFQAMDGLDLLMIEQPLDYEDIYDHSRLRPLIHTPLCLDESIHSADHARYALAIGACDIINIKPGRVGGWTEARKVHDLCRSQGIPVWCGGMLETGVGRAAQLALASLPGFTLPGDISATARYYAEDIATHFSLNPEDSTISVPTAPGLGVEVNMARLARVTLQKETYVYR